MRAKLVRGATLLIALAACPGREQSPDARPTAPAIRYDATGTGVAADLAAAPARATVDREERERAKTPRAISAREPVPSPSVATVDAARPAPAPAPSARKPAVPAGGKSVAAPPPTKPVAGAPPTRPVTALSQGKPDAGATAAGAAKGPEAVAASGKSVAAPPPTPGAKPDGGAATASATAPAPPARDAGREPDAPPLNIEAEIAGGGPSPSDLMKIPMRGAKPRPPATPPPLPIPGGPLPIPGAEVDLRGKRVDRFLEEGGTALAGQILDVDGAKPVPNAKIEAWMGTRSIHAVADGDGKFAFEGLVPGSRITLWITASPTYVQERTEYAVPSGRPQVNAAFKMIARAAVSGAQDGGVGVFLARRGNRTVVSGLVAFGAAERAGLNTGDALLTIGKRSVTDLGPGAIEYLLRGPIGSEVQVTVQSGSQPPRTVTIRRTGR